MGPVPKTLKIEPASAKPQKKKTRSRSAQRTPSTPVSSSTSEEKLKAKLFDLEAENVQLKKNLEKTTKSLSTQKTKQDKEIALLQAKLKLAEQNVETLMQEQLQCL